MNGKQLLAAIEKFDQEMADAYGEGDDFPVIEATIPIDAQNVIRRRYGDVPAEIFKSINEKIESLNEAMGELDHELEVLKYIATGLAESEKLAQQVADMSTPDVPVRVGEPTEHTDEHKVKKD